MTDTRKIMVLILLLISGWAAQAETLEVEIANRLSALSRAETLGQVDEIIEKAQEYLKSHRTGSNKVTLGFLQADIIQTHGRVYADFWLADKKKDEAVKSKAKSLLEDSISKYGGLSEQADEKAEVLVERLRGSASRSSRWREFAGYPSRANYARGWSYYSLGLLDDKGEEGNENLLQAMEFFQPFLNAGYRDNRIVQDCFMGYGLCLYEMDRFSEARDLLNERRITPANTRPDAFKQITLLRIRIHEDMKSDLGVELVGRLYFQNRPGDAGDYDPVEHKIAFRRIAALAHLSASQDNPYASAYLQQLNDFRREFAGSVPQRSAKVAHILDTAGVETSLGTLRKAKETYARRNYEEALAQTQAGLELVDREFESETAVDLEYLKCLCLNELGRYGDVLLAAKAFIEDYANDSRIGVVSKIAIESVINLVKAGGEITLTEFDALAAVYADHHPDSDMDASLLWYQASFYISKGWYSKAEELLGKSGADGPVRLRHLYLHCFAAYQQYRYGDSDPERLARAFETLVEFGRRVQVESPENWVCVGMFDLALAVMDEYVRSDASVPEPMALIEAIESFNCGDAVRQQKFLATKARFFATCGELEKLRDILQQAKRQKGDGMLNQSFLIAAELLTAQLLPTDFPNSETAKARSSLAADLFGFLLETSSQEDGDGKRRCQILWKLAESLREAGRFDLAVKRYNEILKADSPRVQARVIRGLAISHQAMGHSVQAAKHWRYLARTLGKGQPDWYEANYELIVCHRLAGDNEKAGQLLDYFYVKYTDPLPLEWASKFDQLKGEGTP